MNLGSLQLNRSKLLKYIIFSIHVILTVVAFFYVTERLHYLVFSITFLALVLSATEIKKFPSLMYFSILFWIGYFVKISAHAILRYPFGEPIGQFKGTTGDWQAFFMISSLACLPFLLINCLVILKNFRTNITELKQNRPVQSQYLSAKKFYLSLAAVAVLAIVIEIINFKYGLYIIGLTARTILPWPTISIVSWFLYIGVILIFCEFYCFAIDLGVRRFTLFLVLLFISFIASVSTLSRGTIVYQVFPIVCASIIYQYPLRIKLRELILQLMVFLMAIGISISVVGGLRNVAFANWQTDQINETDIWGKNIMALSVNETFFLFLRLSVDRWIGAEGLMAVISYPKKSDDLFWSRRVWSQNDQTTNIINEIANSPYKIDQKKPFRFSVLPGLVAFLYYSNSIIYILLGCLFVYLIMAGLDLLVFSLRFNVFTSHVVAFWLANSAAQFGIYPAGLGKGLIFIFGFLSICYFLIPKINRGQIQ